MQNLINFMHTVSTKTMFRILGHDKAWVLDGGFPQWQASGFNIASSCPDDAVLKSKAANRAVEAAYNGKLVRYLLRWHDYLTVDSFLFVK